MQPPRPRRPGALAALPAPEEPGHRRDSLGPRVGVDVTSLYHPQPQIRSMVWIITLLVPMDACSPANNGTENTLLDFRQALEAMKALDSKEPDVSTNNKSWAR